MAWVETNGGIPPHLSLPGHSIPEIPFATKHSVIEEHMCPVCIASTALMVAGAGSTGGILAVCIGKFRQLFRAKEK